MLPVSKARATRSARPTSRVQIEPERPYCESLAMRTPSSSESNGITATTGPKISSRAMVMSGIDVEEDGGIEVRAGAFARLAAGGQRRAFGSAGGRCTTSRGRDARR